MPCLLTLLDAGAVLLQTCCRMAGCCGPCTPQSQNRSQIQTTALPSTLSYCHGCNTLVTVRYRFGLGKLSERADSAFYAEGLMGWRFSEARAHRESITFAKSTMLAPKALVSMLDSASDGS